MTHNALIFGTLALAALAGCSGGGGGSTAVYADGPPPATIDDLVGLKFPVRSAELESEDNFATATAGLRTYTLEFTSATTADLTTPEGVVSLTEVAGVFTGNIGDTIYEVEPQNWGHDYLEGFSVVSSEGLNDLSFAIGTLGLETRPEDLPEGAVFAVYTGPSTLIATIDGVPFTEDGAANLTASFTGQVIDGNVFVGGTTTLSIDGPTPISGNGFSAPLLMTSPTATLIDGSTSGRFYGDAAQVVGGTYSGQATELGADIDFTGVIHAD